MARDLKPAFPDKRAFNVAMPSCAQGFVRAAVTLNYTRASHCEALRATWMQLYAVFYFGIVSLVFSWFRGMALFPSLFLCCFCVLNLLAAIKVSIEFWQHMTWAQFLSAKCTFFLIARPVNSYDGELMKTTVLLSVRAIVLAFHVMCTSFAFSLAVFLLGEQFAFVSSPYLATFCFATLTAVLGWTVRRYWIRKKRRIVRFVRRKTKKLHFCEHKCDLARVSLCFGKQQKGTSEDLESI